MDIEWLIYHLIHNDDDQFTSIVDLDIDLIRSDLDQWDRLLMGFSRNRTITSIELSRGYQRPVVAEDDLQILFSSLRKLPKLSKVKLDSFTTFDLEQTRSLFVNNNIIEEIWIENAQCYCEEEEEEEERLDEGDADEDYSRYELFLGYLVSMSRNRLRYLRIEVPEKLSHAANITSLLDGSSKLESVVIETTSVLSPTAPSTRKVSPNEEDRHRNFATAMAALQSNFVLKTLDVDFRITFADFKHVATMLKHNRALNKLCLRLETTPGTTCGVNKGINSVQDYDRHFTESIQLFFEALKTNTNSALKSFSQYNLDDPELRLMLSAPRYATSLTTSSKCATYPKKAQNLIDLGLDMLQFNLSLENFAFFLFDRNDPDLTKKKQMFLRLNIRGRRLVQHRDISESVPKSSWVDQLSKHSMDDLDGLYYYISTNPLICNMMFQEDPTLSTQVVQRTFDENNTQPINKREEATKSAIKRCHVKANREALPSQNKDKGLILKSSETKRQRFDNDNIV